MTTKLAYDTETALIRPGRQAPELACLTYAGFDNREGLLHWQDPYIRDFIEGIVLGAELIVGQNVAFDMAVIAAFEPRFIDLIFKAYDEDRVTCTMLRQQLIDISNGVMRGYVGRDGTWQKYRYNLGALGRRHHLPYEIDKDDVHRLKYGQYRELPLEQWPEGAKTYPVIDARGTRDVFLSQGKQYIPDEFERARAFFALQLTSVWGVRCSAKGVENLKKATQHRMGELRESLILNDLAKKDGSRSTKKAQEFILEAWTKHVDWKEDMCRCFKFVESRDDEERTVCGTCGRKPGIVRRTDSGAPCLDGDACDAVEDPVVASYGEYSVLMYVLSKDVPTFEKGTVLPIHTRFGMVDTVRTNSTNPQLQNLRRDEGIREMIIPRDGWCIWDGDYPQLELYTLSDICVEWFGESKLAEALMAGLDPHSVVAAQILNISYDDVKKELKTDKTKVVYKAAFNARQGGKVVNFGKPLGLGNETLIEYARKTYGVDIGPGLPLEEKIAEAAKISKVWFQTWPEMRQYMSKIKTHQTERHGFAVEMPHTKILRAGMTFTSACSYPSQGLGAVCATRGHYEMTRECYTARQSPTYGGRPINFVHDQSLIELPFQRWGAQRTHDASMRLAELMAQGANRYLHHVQIHVEPALSMCWSKNAEPVYDEEKRMIPWTKKN